MPQRAKLEPRLAAGFLDGLAADGAALRRLTDGKLVARKDKEAASLTEDEAQVRGEFLVSRFRRQVRTGAPADRALWRAFGVGARGQGTTGRVTAALTAIIDAAAAHPDKSRAVGILQADLDDASACVAALVSADKAQGTKKLSSKQATAAARSTQKRLEDQLLHLASIASAALPQDAAARFEELLPAMPAGKKKPASVGPAS